MLGLQKYLDKLYQTKWYIDEECVDDVSEMLLVTFKQQNDYYLLETIHYSYFDILTGLEELEFDFTKRNNDLNIKILKI